MTFSRRGISWAAEGTLLALASLLYFIDLFLPWSQACSLLGHRILPFPTPFNPAHVASAVSVCQAQTGGWGGAGTVAGVLVGLLFLWEVTRVARLALGLGRGYRSLVSAGLAFGVLIFAVINVVARLTWDAPQGVSLVYGGLFLWISLGLAVVIGFGGLAHWQIWAENAPPAHPPAPPVAIPPEAAPSAPTGVCPSCGQANSPEARFCSACGSQLSGQPRRRTPRRPAPPP